MSVIGVITPSQGVLTYCDYNSSERELTLKTCEIYEVLLSGDDTTVFFWKSSKGYTEYFPKGVVLSRPIRKVTKSFLLFPARVEAPVNHGE